MISPRSNYITLLKSRRNKSIEKTRQAYLGHKNPYKLKLTGNKNYSNDHTNGHTHIQSQQRERPYMPRTQRKNSLNKSHSINRQSISKLESLTTRQQSKSKQKQRQRQKERGKKQLSAWSKACQALNKSGAGFGYSCNYEEQRKRFEEGASCRVVVMAGGKGQSQYFVPVKMVQDIRNFMARVYRNTNFATIPRQISLQFLLTQSNISGQFLNGQTIYLKPQPPSPSPNPSPITMQDFQLIKQIGSGGFSKVFLCKSKLDGNFYAMKLIQKQMVIKNKKKKIVMNQRLIMEDSRHPFIIELKYAFEAERYIVFVLEYCAGGQLFGLIKRFRRLSEEMARFYIIQIFLGLAYLHAQKVVYRDIKPQNILLSIDGHIKIADLGLAKPNMHEGELAYSFCGSPEYMSPQMIMQVGHTYPVDYYCMGALLYELLVGLPPFYSQDPEEIYQAVLVEELSYPNDVELTPQCRSLLKALLCKDPKKRLGSLYGTKEILAHPWFGKQKYDNYLQKKVQPPLHFKNLQKLNLDTNTDDKNKETWDRVLKDQKYQKKQFKEIMKNFYYNFEPPLEKIKSQRSLVRKVSTPKLDLTENQKQNIQNLRRTQKKNTGVMITRNPLQKMFNK